MKGKHLVILICLMLLLAGCSGKTKLENNLNQIRIALGDDGTAPQSFSNRARALKEALKEMEGIKSANVVITGHTALIGLRVEEEDLEEISRMKKEAARIAKEKDQGIYHTAITTNEEIVMMIEEMEEQKES